MSAFAIRNRLASLALGVLCLFGSGCTGSGGERGTQVAVASPGTVASSSGSDDSIDQKAAALSTAKTYLETLATYTPDNFQSQVEYAGRYATSEWREHYEPTTSQLRTLVTETGATTQGIVDRAGVIELKARTARVSVTLRQVQSTLQLASSQTSTSAVVVTLVRQADGTWLVNDVSVAR